MKIFIQSISLFCFLILSVHIFAQAEEQVSIKTQFGEIHGTLLTPKSESKIPVVIFIVGSGPTNRDGNSLMAGANNSLKFLAEALAKEGIATLRYDKRGIAESKGALDSVQNLRLDDWVNDASAWVDFLSERTQFSTISILGHSQGSLVGMLASNQNKKVAKYISLAGAGEPINKILEKQLGANPAVAKMAKPLLDSLSQGHLVQNVPGMLAMLFNKPTQPFLISWMKYDPAKEIVKMTIPCLIVQGDTDLQVKVEDAQKLHKAQPKSELMLIENMNHVLKNVSADITENYASYSNPDLPVKKELVDAIVRFILF